MKKFKSLVVLLVFVLMLSGCVKTHTTMTINSDKSMVYESEILFADSLSNEAGSMVNPEDFEKKGYTVTNVTENGYSGFKLNKKINSIDDMANNKGEEVVISNFLNDDFNTKVVFKLEKGFLKNTYVARFKYSSDENYSNQMSDNDNLDDSDVVVDTVEDPEDGNLAATENTDELQTEENEATNTNEDEGLSESIDDSANLENMMSLMNEMEFTYKVNLPVKSNSNNATSVSNDGKTLTWNLSTNSDSKIEFSFSLLNMTNIIILGGGVLLVIVIIIVVLIVSKKKKASKETLIHTDYDPSIANNVSVQPENGMVNDMSVGVMPSQPEASPVMPQTDNLQFDLPTENTQNQINIEPQQPQFITPEIEQAVDNVANTAPVTPVQPMVQEPSVPGTPISSIDTPSVMPTPIVEPTVNAPVAPTPIIEQPVTASVAPVQEIETPGVVVPPVQPVVNPTPEVNTLNNNNQM